MLITPGIHGSESPLTFTPTEDLFQAPCYCDGEPREGRESACGKLLRSEAVSIRMRAAVLAAMSLVQSTHRVEAASAVCLPVCRLFHWFGPLMGLCRYLE